MHANDVARGHLKCPKQTRFVVWCRVDAEFVQHTIAEGTDASEGFQILISIRFGFETGNQPDTNQNHRWWFEKTRHFNLYKHIHDNTWRLKFANFVWNQGMTLVLIVHCCAKRSNWFVSFQISYLATKSGEWLNKWDIHGFAFLRYDSLCYSRAERPSAYVSVLGRSQTWGMYELVECMECNAFK